MTASRMADAYLAAYEEIAARTAPASTTDPPTLKACA